MLGGEPIAKRPHNPADEEFPQNYWAGPGHDGVQSIMMSPLQRLGESP